MSKVCTVCGDTVESGQMVQNGRTAVPSFACVPCATKIKDVQANGLFLALALAGISIFVGLVFMSLSY